MSDADLILEALGDEEVKRKYLALKQQRNTQQERKRRELSRERYESDKEICHCFSRIGFGVFCISILLAIILHNARPDIDPILSQLISEQTLNETGIVAVTLTIGIPVSLAIYFCGAVMSTDF